jgi:hypothetical protein
MSNRARRRLLWEWRLRAIVAAGISPSDTIERMDAWNRWRRDAFRSIWRAPLRQPGGTLATIQYRNGPAGFHLLNRPFPDAPRYSPIWPEILEPFEASRRILFEAVNRLQRVIKSPTLQRAARAIGGVDRCLRQHSKEYGPAHAARLCLRGAHIDRLADCELVALMAANRARLAAENLAELARAIQEEAGAAGIDAENHENAFEHVRARRAAWERQNDRYARVLLADARELLALADLEAKKEAAAEDSHQATSAKGGRKPKGSKGLRKLAAKLQKERPESSDQRIFDLAVDRCNADGSIEIQGYTVTTNSDGKLLSTDPEGQPDGRPVGFSGWRKILAT